MTLKEFALHLDVDCFCLCEILYGKKNISADFALSLADAFNVESEFRLNLQIRSELWHARKDLERLKPLKKFVGQLT